MMDLLLPDSPLWLTLKVAFLATLAAAAAGVSVGFGLARSRSTWGDWLDALLALPQRCGAGLPALCPRGSPGQTEMAAGLSAPLERRRK